MLNIRAEEIQWHVDSCHALAMQMRKQDYHCSSANSIFLLTKIGSFAAN